jgi:hypothetical protein
MKIEAHGPVNSVAHLKDIVQAHKRDGYIKHVTYSQVSYYWSCSFPVVIIDGMPDMKGAALILYTGTYESFEVFKREMEEGLQKLAKKRKDEMGRFVQ